MKRVILITIAAFAAFTSQGILAEGSSAGAGGDRAATSKPATKAEKEAAKQARRATSKQVAKDDSGRLEDKPTSAGTAGTHTKEQKDAAKTQRRADGKAAAAAGSGRLDDEGSAATGKKP